MKDKTWEVEYDGYRIQAINKVQYFPPKTSEMLMIDDEVIEHITDGGFFTLSVATVKCTHELNGIERHIELRFAPKTTLPSTGCQIFVDGIKVGGDDEINYPDPAIERKQFEKGYPYFFNQRPSATRHSLCYRYDNFCFSSRFGFG